MSNTFVEPTWAAVQEVMQPTDSRFSLAPATPFDLTGAFVRLIQFHFSNADHILNTSLKALLWNSDIKLSKILITPGFSRDIQEESKKPSIFVERGAVTPVPLPTPIKTLGINIMVNHNTGAASTNLSDNTKRFATMKGVHNIICEGLTPVQTELLAEEIFMRFMYFSPAIEDDFHLESFDIGGMTPLQAREDRPNESDIVSISFTWQKMYIWGTVQELPV